MNTPRSARALTVALACALMAALALVTYGCSGVPSPTESRIESETTIVSVYYPNGEMLVEERHIVPVDENMPQVAIGKLFEASPEVQEIAVVLPAATVNSVTVNEETGECTVDFSAGVLEFPGEGDTARVVALASIVETLKQFPEVESLTITVEGESSGALDGKRIEEFWGNVRLPAEPMVIVRD